MKKKIIPDKLKKLVVDSLRRHAWNMGVSHYTGDVLYMEEDKIKPLDDGLEERVEMDIIVHRKYLKATIRIYPQAIKNWQEQGDKYIEKAMAHEVAHILTEHMWNLITAAYKDEGEVDDARESLTQQIANISVKLDEQLKHK